MNNFITTDWLNLRNSPTVSQNQVTNVIGVMPPGTIVEQISNTDDSKWLHIKTILGNDVVEGYASLLFLAITNKTLDNAGPALPDIPEVHLPIKSGQIIRRSETSGRAFHLHEVGMKQFDITKSTDSSSTIQKIHEILDWIDVEHSARYSPTSASTYCNIYAHDLSFCCGLFIPRVWWTEKAFAEILQGKTPDIIYEKTVTELNANALTNWFENHGSSFGWKREFDVDTLQNKVNLGSLGIIVAQRINLNRSGHIITVIPENGLHKAQRDNNNKIISPLQSQAGSVNKKYFTGNNWWVNPNKFRKFGMWVCEK